MLEHMTVPPRDGEPALSFLIIVGMLSSIQDAERVPGDPSEGRLCPELRRVSGMSYKSIVCGNYALR